MAAKEKRWKQSEQGEVEEEVTWNPEKNYISHHFLDSFLRTICVFMRAEGDKWVEYGTFES